MAIALGKQEFYCSIEKKISKTVLLRKWAEALDRITQTLHTRIGNVSSKATKGRVGPSLGNKKRYNEVVDIDLVEICRLCRCREHSVSRQYFTWLTIYWKKKHTQSQNEPTETKRKLMRSRVRGKQTEKNQKIWSLFSTPEKVRNWENMLLYL